MDFANTMAGLNWLAVVVAALSSFLLGGVWYGPLFGRAWMKANGFNEEDLKNRNMALVFGVSFLLSLLVAFNLAMFVGLEGDWAYGALAGLLAGVGWVAAFLGILYLFEKKSLKLFAVNGGYCALALTLMGVILGAWR